MNFVIESYMARLISCRSAKQSSSVSFLGGESHVASRHACMSFLWLLTKSLICARAGGHMGRRASERKRASGHTQA